MSQGEIKAIVANITRSGKKLKNLLGKLMCIKTKFILCRYIISKDTENAIIINKCHWEGGVMAFTLNDAGEIGSQDHAMVTKILDFIHKHPN